MGEFIPYDPFLSTSSLPVTTFWDYCFNQIDCPVAQIFLWAPCPCPYIVGLKEITASQCYQSLGASASGIGSVHSTHTCVNCFLIKLACLDKS